LTEFFLLFPQVLTVAGDEQGGILNLYTTEVTKERAAMTTAAMRFTSTDLEAFPDDGKRREIIDGELYVSKQPSWYHQMVCGRIFAALDDWSIATGAGGASVAPGLIFAEDEDVAPDVAWASGGRLTTDLAKGKLYTAAELLVEVLSPGKKNIQCDRETKLKLYARHGVSEYWIVDWPQRTVDVYHLIDDELQFVATLTEHDSLTSALLPGFNAALARIFVGLPAKDPEA
jgi:Uma2 family endonuclease